MKVLYILNSDFGVSGTVGFRALPTTNILFEKKENFKILCRDFNKYSINPNYNIEKIIPLGSLPMKIINGIKVYFFKNFPTNKINSAIFNYFILKKLKNIDLKSFDIVHSWDFLPEVFDYIKSQNPKIKIIKDMTMSFQNILENKIKTEKYWKGISSKVQDLELSSLKYVDYYILPAQSTKDSLLLSGVKENQILFISYGVNYNLFKECKERTFNSKFKVAFAGNVNHRKGVGYLIEAWNFLKLKNAELNIYGRVYPEVEPMLRSNSTIKVHGFVNLSKELPKNHILVHPSLLETTPKSLKEGMASGLTIITTYNSGPDFKDNSEGFIINEQSSKEIVQKLKLLYDDRKKLENMCKKSRSFSMKKSWEDYGLEVYKNYKKILK